MDLTEETHSLLFYCATIIGPIGICTNLMNIKVSKSEEIQKTTMSFFNIRLSIFNILSITLVGLIWGFPQSIGYQVVVLTSDSACKLIPYLTRIITQMSSWLLVMASFDRMFMLMSYKNLNNVRKTDKQEVKDTRKYSWLLIGLFFLFCLINSPNLFFSLQTQAHINTTTPNKTSQVLCTSKPTVVLVRDIVSRTICGILPFILQIVISVSLIYRLYKLGAVIHTVPINRERKYTFTIIVFNIIFLLSDIFNTVCLVFINIYGYNDATYISTDSREAAIASYVYLCSLFCNMFCICVMLFFINLITNKRYRKEAIRIFLY
jgi:nitrate reductase NapE component